MGERGTLAAAFLVTAGWGGAEHTFLAGDASARRYERLFLSGRNAILMDAPPGTGEDVGVFVSIDAHLRGIGLSAPEVIAKDEANGFVLLEDLGDDLYSRILARDPVLERPIYSAAVDVIAAVQSHAPPAGLTDASAAEWAAAASFALDWYRYAVTGERAESANFVDTLTDLLSAYADGPRVMILRDYHAENLLWLPHRSGLARVGLLDFQLAQMGQPGYDLVSLCQDARRDVAPETEAFMVARFLDQTGTRAATFDAAYACLGAQRALRIIGVFARLALVAGKPGYIRLIPRVWGQLQQNLAHPALHPLADICATLLPEPTPARLERILRLCPEGR